MVLSSAWKPLCCLPAPLSQPLLESLGFSSRFCSPTSSPELGKLYCRCAVPAPRSRDAAFLTKKKSHEGRLNRGIEKAQNSSFFLSSCNFFNDTGQDSNCKAVLPGPKSSDFLLPILLGININLITSPLVSHSIFLCLIPRIRESPFKNLLFAVLSNPQQPLPGSIRLFCRRNRLWQKQFCTQTLQTLLFSPPTPMPPFVLRGVQRISSR